MCVCVVCCDSSAKTRIQICSVLQTLLKLRAARTPPPDVTPNTQHSTQPSSSLQFTPGRERERERERERQRRMTAAEGTCPLSGIYSHVAGPSGGQEAGRRLPALFDVSGRLPACRTTNSAHSFKPRLSRLLRNLQERLPEVDLDFLQEVFVCVRFLPVW